MKKANISQILLLGCAALVLTGCVQSSSGGGSGTLNIEQQVQQHDVQLRQLQPAQADAWNQLQAMRQELNTIKGQLDDLQNVGGARAIVDRMRQHDEALRQVESRMAMQFNLGEPMPAVPTGVSSPVYQPAPNPVNAMAPAAAAPATGSYGLPAATPQAADQTGSYGLPATPGQSAQASVPPSGSTWGQASPQPTLQVPKKDISLALFDAGTNAFNARNYTEAERSFSDFLKNYKGHNLAPEAQFYLAECYFQRNDFANAALEYDKVIKGFPKSSSAPGAYLKQGICFSKLKQNAAAKARMQELIKKFPNSPEAARAKSFLKTNK